MTQLAKMKRAVPRFEFELEIPEPAPDTSRRHFAGKRRFASASAALSENVLNKAPSVVPPPSQPMKVQPSRMSCSPVARGMEAWYTCF